MKHRIRMMTALLLSLALLLCMGCERDPAVQEETSLPTAVPATEPSAEPSLSWKEAFRDNTLPEGTVTTDCIAFYQVDGDGQVSIVNVPKQEVFAFRPERLPRTRYFESYMSRQVVEELLPILDYAQAHCYCRCSIPTTTLNRGLVHESAEYLNLTYRINGGGVGSLDVRTYPTEDGQTLSFLLVTLSGMDGRGMMQEYLEGIAAAEAVVDSVPEGADEYQTALYLYRYLTENVTYYDGDYYAETSRNFLYDAMVKHETVCSGYTEALYFLYNLAGLDCITIEGYISTLGYGPDVGGGHIWNIAKVNGEYYQFDSTWDAGDGVEDYQYFGVSDEFMLARHTDRVAQFCTEYAPACSGSLLPETDPGLTDTYPGLITFWYYRFRNARDTDPMRLFSYLSEYFGEEEVTAEEPQDGWVKLSLTPNELKTRLTYVMTEEEAVRFFNRGFEKRGGKAAFRVKEEKPACVRLCSMTKQSDGTWLASGFLVDEKGSVEPWEERVVLTEYDGYYWVSSAG